MDKDAYPGWRFPPMKVNPPRPISADVELTPEDVYRYIAARYPAIWPMPTATGSTSEEEDTGGRTHKDTCKCGAELTTDETKRAGICEACAFGRL